MAGRFLTVEEAARQLGVDADEVNRLVDRKKLFPMRDGGTPKFKYDDIVRFAESRGESSDVGDDLAIDLNPRAAAEPVSILDMDLGSDAIGEAIDAGASIFDEPAASKGVSETFVRGLPAESEALAIGSGLSLRGSKLSDIAIDGGSSRPSLAIGSDAGGGSGPVTGGPGGGLVGGGAAATSGIAGVTGIGDRSGLSVAGESGLSLEDEDVQLSGIQLSGVDLSGAGFSVGEGSGIDLGAVGDEDAAADGGTMLAGESFELGVSGGDEESASVVIATDSESGDSSFFGATMVAGESSASEESSLQVGDSSIHYPVEMLVGTSFSGLQICGLVCCSLLLLIGGFICFDLISSIGSVRGVGFTAPILEGLTTTLGLR